MLLSAAAVALALIGIEPAPQPGDSEPPVSYPIAAETEAERTHASSHFSATWIHDPASPDAPGLKDRNGDDVPDSVTDLLGAFETARAFLLERLGYRPPPVSGPLRLYISGREGPAVTHLAPGGSEDSRPSYVVVPAGELRGTVSPRQLRILAVHEYFHAIQNGYNPSYDHWIGEATATWVEDVFDDGANSNHDVLKSFVPQPRTSLTSVDGPHEYGAFLFVQFLVERYADGDPGIVRELWEEMATAEPIDAIRAVLDRRDASLPAAWSEFLLWRWDLERFEEGRAYERALGDAWPKPLQSTEVRHESCRLSSDLGSGLPPLSGDYSVFRPDERPNAGTATVTVEGRPGATAFILVERVGGKEKAQLLEIGEDGLASARVKFGDQVVRRVVLGVGNPAATGSPARLAYSLRLIGRSGVDVRAVGPRTETHFFGGLPLRGRVTCNGQPAPMADVLLVQTKRSGEEKTFPLSTAADGTWSTNIEPEQTSTYRVEVLDPLISPATSPPWEVAVKVALTLEATTPEVTLGSPASVEGKVTPSHPGALVQIDYRRPDLSWRTGPRTNVEPDGTYRASLTLPSTGIWNLRATVLSTGDGDHVGTETVHDVLVNVR